MPNRFTRDISLKGERVTYILEYKNIKNVNIHCTPQKGLYISAPFHADLERIDNYLKENSDRILDAVHRAKLSSKRKNTPRSEQRKLVISGRTVSYELNYKDVKRINLSVSPQKGVRISAPHCVKVKDIEKFMIGNSDFIIKALEKYEKQSETLPAPKKYCSGEYIYFLGKRRNIKITQDESNHAEIIGETFRIFVSDPENYALKSAIVDAFLKNSSAQVIIPMCKKLYPKFKAEGIEFPEEIRFRKMISCWGNCRPARSILTFSTHLVQLPEKCIEQVICHEFTHFLHADHSKAFYAQLAQFMPDWKKYDTMTKKLQNEIIIR